MNTTQVIVNDFPSGRRMIILLDPEEFMRVDANWEDTDRILQEVQHIPFFTGKTRWCDLDPGHFRLMIASNLAKIAEAPDEEKTEDNMLISGLHFLLASLVACLQKRAECHIELLRVNRIADGEVTFDFSGCLTMATDLPKRRQTSPGKGLRVIVDNT